LKEADQIPGLKNFSPEIPALVKCIGIDSPSLYASHDVATDAFYIKLTG